MTKTTCKVCARDYDLEVRHVCPGETDAQRLERVGKPFQLVPKQGDPIFAEVLREYADKVENGEITSVLIVTHNGEENVFERAGIWQDRWHLLGALEYAKNAVHLG